MNTDTKVKTAEEFLKEEFLVFYSIPSLRLDLLSVMEEYASQFKSEWIAFSYESMPSINILWAGFLAVCKNEVGNVFITTIKRHENGGWADPQTGQQYSSLIVTHWQPLPSLPSL